ncbi:MAG: tetraacyldisaccharide 4'-kinase, partial [Bacteroidetes bacterium]|nr:tetraacyldisaccharide 4'-kinase [Bacteroidota bacterium]
MDPLRIVLAPLALLYGMIMLIRNQLYRSKILASIKFDLPVFSVGNLNVGGTGKSPMIEYIIKLLRNENKVATLSRGYGRRTDGFKIADNTSTAFDIGDEPMQFKYKFSNITVAVGENRALAIPDILMQQPGTNVILMDDAFQHLGVTPGLS